MSRIESPRSKLTHRSTGVRYQPWTIQQTSQVEADRFHRQLFGGQVQTGFRILRNGQIIQLRNVQQHPMQKPKLLAKCFNCVTKTTKPEPDLFDDLLVNNGLRRTLRVFAWVKWFIHNSQNQEKRLDPLDTNEVEEAKTWWIKRIQSRDEMEVHYKETSARLGLRTDERGITVCGGRILGSHPTYLPRDAAFTQKLVQRIHCDTLHGGVGLTMAALREKYWVPRLRSLVKAVRSKCWGCKRFRLQAITPPIPGQLPNDKTTVGTAFEIIGVDFAGPIRYRKSSKAEGKAYLAIFACSLSRAVHLELLRNLETGTFIICLKRFIARRGRPRVVYSDNGGTFVKASKWLEQIRKDEKLRGLLEGYEIKWKFYLSRAPWWGGQFERGTWPLGIVEEIYPGKDNVVRAVRVKTPTGSLERAVQHLYPMELRCDVNEKTQPLDPQAATFNPRPKRDAAVAARVRIEQVTDEND